MSDTVQSSSTQEESSSEEAETSSSSEAQVTTTMTTTTTTTTTTATASSSYSWNGLMLAGIYNLPHQDASFLQDTDMCWEYEEIISDCLDTLLNRTFPPAWCSKEEELNLLKKCKILMDNAASGEETNSNDGGCDNGDSVMNLRWLEYFPEYGSLVMAHAHPQQLAGTVSVSVLGLDGYEFGLHSATAGGNNKSYDYLSHAHTYKVLFVGTLVDSDLEQFQRRFAQLLSSARAERKGDKRSAAKGDQGHQFTPSLINALLIQAKKCKCPASVQHCACPKVVVPKGGFTDNGLHTGGKPRNTSFPLVRSFFQWCMIQSGDSNRDYPSCSSLFRRCMVFLDLYIVDAWLGQVVAQQQDDQVEISSFPQVRIHLNWAMTILGAAALKFEKLNVEDNSMLPLLEYAQELKKKIDQMHENMQDVEAAEFQLGDLATELGRPNAFRNPVLRLKPERPTPKTIQMLKEKCAKLSRNIGPVPLVDPTASFDVKKLYTWACSSLLRCSDKIEHAHLVIGTIERAFWERAEKGLESDILDAQSVDVLLKLVNRYRTVVHILLTTSGDAVSRKTEVYSREFLVVWVAYCLIFAANRKLYHHFVPDMGVALKYDDLEHLVLCSKREWSIVHVVKCFLQKYYVPDREIFSQRCPEATFVMVRRCPARSCGKFSWQSNKLRNAAQRAIGKKFSGDNVLWHN